MDERQNKQFLQFFYRSVTDLATATETPETTQSISVVWPPVPLTSLPLPITCPHLRGITTRQAPIMTGVCTHMTRGAGVMTGDGLWLYGTHHVIFSQVSR